VAAVLRATRNAAKICAYTYAFLVNRMLGCPRSHQGAMSTNLATQI
jgi:hypothetical protein